MTFRLPTIELLAISAMILSGCSSSLDREEAGVYAAYVDAHFTKVADSSESLKRHVICDHTSGFQIVGSWKKEILKLQVSPRSDTIDDFLARNDGNFPESSLSEETRSVVGRYPLNPHASFRLPHVLISDATIQKIFIEGGDGWFEFGRRYRKHHGIIWLSRVGFSQDRCEAILYVGNQYSPGAGLGILALLRKLDGNWKEVATATCWIS